MTRRTFSDGCHKWGWLIQTVVTIATGLILIARLTGAMEANQQQFDKRLDKLEQAFTQFLLEH